MELWTKPSCYSVSDAHIAKLNLSYSNHLSQMTIQWDFNSLNETHWMEFLSSLFSAFHFFNSINRLFETEA